MSDPIPPNVPPGVPPNDPVTPPPGSVPPGSTSGTTPPPAMNYASPMTSNGGLFAPPPVPPLPARPDERTMGMLAHLLALSGLVIPFGNIVGPLVIWLMNKDKMPFVDDQGKESLNFQITITIAAIVAGIVTFCLLGIGALVVVVVGWVFAVIAGVKANNGEPYRYPFSMRLVK